jgi:excisionase family DNA binding protein
MKIFKTMNRIKDETKAIPDRLQYGMKEAAILLGVCERTLATMITQGQIASYKVRSKRFISRDALKQFVANAGAK